MLTMEENDIITCGCCGRGLRHNAKENNHFGQEPYPDDIGMGMCVACGGDKSSANTRERLGWAGCTFYDARIEVLSDNLNPENKAKFESMPYEKKIVIIGKLIERGAMI